MSLVKDPKNDKSFFRARLIAAIVIIGILCGLLITRLFFLQVIEHHRYTLLSNQNSMNLIPIVPRRGLIYDRNGVLLAENTPVFSLMLVPDEVKNIPKTLKQLESIIPLSPDELTAFKRQLKQHRPSDPLPLKIKLSKEQVALFMEDQFRFPGLSVQAELTRYYPFGADFSHVVGYVGRINDQDLKLISDNNYDGTNFIGKSGIENYYETLLHGQVGYKRVEVDASGREVRTLSTLPAKPGTSIYLTLDAGLQHTAMKALKGQRGAVAVINPNNGEVLALVSSPGFDPNLFVNGISTPEYNKLANDPNRPLYDRTVRGEYASGSTVKPIFALQGLNNKTISPTYQIFDPGFFKIPGNSHVFHDWKTTGHGWVNVTVAIMESCDTYFYNLAYLAGIKSMDQILNQFGFGQLTKIDLSNELPGVVPTPEWKMKTKGQAWYGGDTVNLGIGQGYFLVTPLQLAVATGILSTRGQGFQPYLLLAKQDGEKKDYTRSIALKPVVMKNPETWDVVTNAMARIISENGVAWGFGTPTNYTAAAKAGTAQVSSIRFGNDYTNVPLHLRPDAWLIVFAPVDHAQIAIASLVENNPSGAAPVARKVADYYFSHLDEFQENDSKK